MNKRIRRFWFIALAAVILVAVVASATLGYFLLGKQPQGTGHFVNQPVVDVILTNLTKAGQSYPEPLNMTRGDSSKIIVEVYPTVDISLYFRMHIFATGSGENKTGSFLITFDPETVSINANSHMASVLTLTALATSPTGSFNAVASVVNQNNSTQTWGIVFTLNVS